MSGRVVYPDLNNAEHDLMRRIGSSEALAHRAAEILLDGIDRHFETLREASAEARQRFETGNWAAAGPALRARLEYYDERLAETIDRLDAEVAIRRRDDDFWRRIKHHYTGLMIDHKRPELAETFFNSVITRVQRSTYVRHPLIYSRATISTEHIPADPPVYRSYYPTEHGFRETLVQIFQDFGWKRPFTDLERDTGYVVRALTEQTAEWVEQDPNHQIQVLSSAFYRNKAAYVIGKVVNGNFETPFVVPVIHDERGGLMLDTVLLASGDLSMLFSLSRAYFLVELDVPSGYVEFLSGIMPHSLRSELYSALGFLKQGKTLFFRDLVHHLRQSNDLFVEAPGTRGQVMHVFNLPSYRYVFKIIKDVFGPTKNIDRDTVKQKFRMVREIDRVGRLADAVEFENLALPRNRFAPELLEELQRVAASSIEIVGDDLIVKHCYVERRMTPLNVYLDHATPAELDRVVRGYGNAIRELAIANIFAGDLLWRNFGVTRHGRVVFYDYDELEYLTDCRFRRVPEPPNPEAEMSSEPWYAASPGDVFPEEFETFLLGDPRVRELFLKYHAQLLTPEFWIECQRRVEAGEVVEFFPYHESLRFFRRYGDQALVPA